MCARVTRKVEIGIVFHWPPIPEKTRHRHVQRVRRVTRMTMKHPLRRVPGRYSEQVSEPLAAVRSLPAISVVWNLGQRTVGHGEFLVQFPYVLPIFRRTTIRPQRRDVFFVVRNENGNIAVELDAKIQRRWQIPHTVDGNAALSPSRVA